jgi:Fe-S cluster assembly iron-binding protein IscA
MALDEPKDTDNVFNVNGFQFIVDKDFYEKVKPVKVDFMGYGFKISSGLGSMQALQGCGGCGGLRTSSHSH